MTTATLLGGFSWLWWFALMSVPYYSLLFLGGLLIYLLNRPEAENLPEGVDPDPPPGFSRDEMDSTQSPVAL